MHLLADLLIALSTALVCCVHRREGLLGTALNASCAALQTFTSALGVAYPLPKLDLVSAVWMQPGSRAGLCSQVEGPSVPRHTKQLFR